MSGPECVDYDDFMNCIASNIARIRKEKKISQLEMSLRLGFRSTSFYAHAEICSMDKRFNLRHIFHIAQILEIDPKDLLDCKFNK